MHRTGFYVQTKEKMQLTKQSASTVAKQHTCAAYHLPRCSRRAHLSVRAVVTPEKPKGSPTSAPSSATAAGQSAVARGALRAELCTGADVNLASILFPIACLMAQWLQSRGVQCCTSTGGHPVPGCCRSSPPKPWFVLKSLSISLHTLCIWFHYKQQLASPQSLCVQDMHSQTSPSGPPHALAPLSSCPPLPLLSLLFLMSPPTPTFSCLQMVLITQPPPATLHWSWCE
jgi:hypothetical protein